MLAERTGWDVINAGISGDTSAQALERLPILLQEHAPALVVVSIGGNDFLRQMSAETAQANIRRICQQAKDSGAQVLLVAGAGIFFAGRRHGALKRPPAVHRPGQRVATAPAGRGLGRGAVQPGAAL